MDKSKEIFKTEKFVVKCLLKLYSSEGEDISYIILN